MLAEKLEDNIEGAIIEVLTTCNKKLTFSKLVSEVNDLSSKRIIAAKIRRAVGALTVSNPDLIEVGESSSGEPTYKALITKAPEESVADAEEAITTQEHVSDEDVADSLPNPRVNKYIVLDEFKKKKWATSEMLSNKLGLDDTVVEQILMSLVSSNHLIIKDVEFEEGKVFSIGSNTDPLEDDYFVFEASSATEQADDKIEEQESSIELTELDYEIYNNLIEKAKSIGVLRNRCVKAGFKNVKKFERRLDMLVDEQFVGVEGNKYYATQYFMDYIESIDESNEESYLDEDDRIDNDTKDESDSVQISTDNKVHEVPEISSVSADKSSKETTNSNDNLDLSLLVRKICNLTDTQDFEESMSDEYKILNMFLDLKEKYISEKSECEILRSKLDALKNIIEA